MTRVSVIMNCYNSARYLREAIESVLGQSFTDWELIFWDNCSTDNSASICKSYADYRIKYHLAEKHTSLGEARNLAVSKAKGEWLAFIDADDVWYMRKLEDQMKLTVDGELGLIYGPAEVVREKTALDGRSYAYYQKLKQLPHLHKNIYKKLLFGNYIIFSSVLIKSEDYKLVGGVDPHFKQNEDYDLLIKISRLKGAACIKNKCMAYRIHEANNSNGQEEIGYFENEEIYRKLKLTPRVFLAKKLNILRYVLCAARERRSILFLKLLRNLLSPQSDLNHNSLNFKR